MANPRPDCTVCSLHPHWQKPPRCRASLTLTPRHRLRPTASGHAEQRTHPTNEGTFLDLIHRGRSEAGLGKGLASVPSKEKVKAE